MKPIDRLKQEYQNYKQANKYLKGSRGQSYLNMRLFCLDCNLVSFAEIQAMEYDVEHAQ